eukprot:TRINITY_DN13109_c0_g1_i1.p1 TRINITY_DN13109_c0_g1~~TRINITY_DN13109_c0_g1_i1.p1  ORF type:complete len:233 (-),score=-15.36 TRINITY_DN13109_c0_g1_i1:336-1034(-)
MLYVWIATSCQDKLVIYYYRTNTKRRQSSLLIACNNQNYFSLQWQSFALTLTLRKRNMRIKYILVVRYMFKDIHEVSKVSSSLYYSRQNGLPMFLYVVSILRCRISRNKKIRIQSPVFFTLFGLLVRVCLVIFIVCMNYRVYCVGMQQVLCYLECDQLYIIIPKNLDSGQVLHRSMYVFTKKKLISLCYPFVRSFLFQFIVQQFIKSWYLLFFIRSVFFQLVEIYNFYRQSV